jgi:hypothetical protein
LLSKIRYPEELTFNLTYSKREKILCIRAMKNHLKELSNHMLRGTRRNSLKMFTNAGPGMIRLSEELIELTLFEIFIYYFKI